MKLIRDQNGRGPKSPHPFAFNGNAVDMSNWNITDMQKLAGFNVEYAMIDSESRLRNSLVGVAPGEGHGNPSHKF